MDEPPRMNRVEAEKDRQSVAMAMRQASATAQFDVAADVLKKLREGRSLPLCDAPASARAHTWIDVGKVAGMNKVQLHALALQLPGFSLTVARLQSREVDFKADPTTPARTVCIRSTCVEAPSRLQKPGARIRLKHSGNHLPAHCVSLFSQIRAMLC